MYEFAGTSKFQSIYKKVTKNLARLGVKAIKKRQKSAEGRHHEVTDTQRTQEVEQRTIDAIQKACNSNTKVLKAFIEACVDLYVYKEIADNKQKRIQTYRKLANRLARMNPRLVALLPNLRSALKPRRAVATAPRP